MSYKTVTLNSFTPVSTPTIVDDTLVDGFVDGRPVVIRKMRDGMMMPAIGTIVTMPYGTGIVSGYRNEMLVVDVVEFNDSFEFETKDIENPDILDATEYVDSLNRCYRRNVESFRADFRRLYKSEITGNLSERNEQRMWSTFPMPSTDTEIVISFTGDYLAPTDYIVVREVTKQRETPSERRARIKAEQAHAKRLADAMLADLDDTDVPEDVMAEIADAFGE